MQNAESIPGLSAVPHVSSRGSLADLVYSALRDAIAGGTLAPGSHLREHPLARHFGVSTTPVREALRRLERDGLVSVHLHRGAVVTAFNPREIVSLYEIREVLECRAVRRAALARPRDFSRVEELLRESKAVAEKPDQIAFNRVDVAFHRALYEVGGNLQLAELIERVHRQIQGVRARCAIYLPGRPGISYAEHQTILAAVKARDADRAEALTRTHILVVRDMVADLLEKGIVDTVA
jgi:DNA-binding GntR family transcriptional regulator